MKFGDKLIALRKKNGLSQEELAEKLNVSRQSVSKWESNNTYPETEKIVQICNLFDCTMDDLINDKITDLESVTRKEKNNLNIVIDSLLEFITKTIDMFSSMTFGSGLKCVIELLIITGIIVLGGVILIEIISSLLSNLLNFIPNNYIIRNILNSVFSIIWFVLTIIILVHVFKIRYLDYFEKGLKEKESKKVTEKEQQKEDITNDNKKFNHQKNKIIIRDSKHEPFAFLSVLSKIIIWFMKFFVAWFALGAVIVLFCLVFGFVIIIPFSIYSMVFFGISITVLAAIVINIQIIILLLKFIFSIKANVKLHSIILLAVVIIGAIGAGVGVVGLKDVEVKDMEQSKKLVPFETKIYYSDTMFIEQESYEVQYKIDNNIPTNEIILATDYDKRLSKITLGQIHEDKMTGYYLYSYNNLNFKSIYEMLIKDLKNNIIRDYGNIEIENIKVIANEETINKLVSNLEKIYLFDKIETKDGFKIANPEYKVIINQIECGGTYNAISDNMTIESPYCNCERKTIETSRGTKIEYTCKYKDE